MVDSLTTDDTGEHPTFDVVGTREAVAALSLDCVEQSSVSRLPRLLRSLPAPRPYTRTSPCGAGGDSSSSSRRTLASTRQDTASVLGSSPSRDALSRDTPHTARCY